MPRSMLTAERLRELLAYDPETGVFARLVDGPGCRNRCGAVVGTVTADGYLQISVDNVSHSAHRLAWLYMTGEWPADEIDHRNSDKLDNRFSNLRPASDSQNASNKGPQANNRSGRRGVYWQKTARKWHVSLQKDGRRHYVGLFETLEAASAAYDAKAVELHGEFARPNRGQPCAA